MNRVIKWLAGGILISVLYFFGCRYFPALPGYHEFHFTQKKYEKEIQNIHIIRKSLSEEYRISSQKEKVLKRAALQFRESLDYVLFPYWFGTDYDFYGNTETPGKGEIACGYFVTTLLEDMGMEIDRAGLAKMASEDMIKKLVTSPSIKRYSNRPLKEVIQNIESEGKGVYIIGLDTHTGFIINSGNGIYFIHASGRYPWQVVEEEITHSEVLNISNYRVTANLTQDELFLKNWLISGR